MKVTIAVVQFKISHLQPKENFTNIEYFIKKAKKQSANVIIFPEDCVTGSIFGDTNWLDTNGKYQKSFQNLAKKYSIDIVTGSYMESTINGNFNTSYYINDHGEILGKYQKNNLYLSERNFLTQGKEIAVFDTNYGRVGIVICWDILFPELFQRMAQAGVQIIYCPSYWYHEIAKENLQLNKDSEIKHIDALCISRAVENNIIFIYANAAGVIKYKQNQSDTLIGHSQITLPFYGPIKKLKRNHQSMFIKTIDISILKQTNQIYKLRNNSN